MIFEPTLPRKGLLKGERNRKFFEEFVGAKEFKDLDKELILTATDLRSLQQVFLTEGLVAKAIQATTAVPGIFVPVVWGDKILGDGANFNLIPSQTLYDHGADYVIAVDVSQPPNLFTRSLSNIRRLLNRDKAIQQVKKNLRHDLNIFHLILRAINMSASQIDKFYHQGYPYDLLIAPDVKWVKRWRIGLVDHCINQGRQAALESLVQIKKDLNLI